MVRKENRLEKDVFVCEECGLAYAKKAIAEKCQAWCSEHQSCNLEIIKHSVNKSDRI